MSHSKWNLEKLSDGNRQLKLSVDSEVIEALKWVWTAKVSVEEGQKESTISIGSAVHNAVGMPDGDNTGSLSYQTGLTNGISKIAASQFASVADEWEQECRRLSTTFDSSVITRRRELERQRAAEERKAENLQEVETFLDSLTSNG